MKGVFKILKKMVKQDFIYNIKYLFIIFFLVFIDLFSKSYALENFSHGISYETFIPFIDFLLIFNSGIAFGIFDSSNILISYILLILTLIIFFYLIAMILDEHKFTKKIALVIISAGALGNIIDRAIDGKVTDFLHLEVQNFSFFVFNLADSFITIGAILIIYFEIINKFKNE